MTRLGTVRPRRWAASSAASGLAALALIASAMALPPVASAMALPPPATASSPASPAAGAHQREETARPALAPTSPTATQTEIEADRPVAVPDTRSCSETVMDHQFANSYGAPFTGTYTPPSACPGPWAAVVLTLTSTVGGTQFDRDVYVAIGGAVMLDGSTSEPCCTGNDVTWTVQRDVTEYTPVLASPQPVIVQLDNVTNSTYTGVYDTTLSLTFYETGPAAPAGAHPDFVLPVANDSPSSPMFTIGADGQTPGTSVVIPRNTDRLLGELYADAHGPCEEFWWSDPTNCAGTPYREVAVYIDGQLAGAAPTYPVTYTGADGPGLWEPIPSPRAWDLRPYVVDLTPFVGELTDGRAHRVDLGILDASLASGDFWCVAANLLGWVDPGSAVTGGALTDAIAPPAPTDDQSWDPTGTLLYQDHSSHQLTFAGYVDTSHGPVFSRVTETMGESDAQTEASVKSSWTWTQTTTTDSAGLDVVATSSATYSLLNSALAAFSFTDDAATSTVTNGVETAWSETRETMTTADASGLIFNGVERERYGYADSTGVCYDRRIDADAGQVTTDRLDGACPGAPVGSGLPGVVPESPWGAALLGVAGAGAAGWALRRRRRRAGVTRA